MDGKVAANIMIAGRSYRLGISPENELIFKRAEKFIKETMRDYDYPDKEKQDILAVTLLDVTVKLLEYQKLNDSRRLEIEKIDRKLGVYLEKQGSLDNIE
jgi:replicative DNA helicase